MDDRELGMKLAGIFQAACTKYMADGAFRELGAAARALFANPAVTREVVADWYEEQKFGTINRQSPVNMILAALSHFAPPVRPKMMIETMADDDAIRIEMVRDADVIAARQGGYNINVIEACARVAHRLANTPAPEHDPDAEARKYLGMWIRACHPNEAERSDEQIWNCYYQMHDAARSFVVAAAKKESGNG